MGDLLWSKATSLFTSAHDTICTNPNGSNSPMPLFQRSFVLGHRPGTSKCDDTDHDREQKSKRTGAFLNDGKRGVDFVLVYKITDDEYRRDVSKTSAKAERRAFFEANLIKEGLILEKDEWVNRRKSCSDDSTVNSDSPSVSTPGTTATVFVKVHGTFATLCRYAERLNVKVPLKLRDAFAEPNVPSDSGQLWRAVYRSIRDKWKWNNRSNSQTTPTIRIGSTVGQTDEPARKAPYVTCPFRRRNVNMYAKIEKQDEFFTPTQRIEIVWEILQNARNDEHDQKKRGIEPLVNGGVYECAFPLHDGEEPEEDYANCTTFTSDRQTLRRTWANWKCIAHTQPLNIIQRYYGEKVAFYFAFLGYYTKMLIYPSIFGMATFLFGLIHTSHSRALDDICNPNADPGNRTMCPICKPPNCGFTKLHEGCTGLTWNYQTDNVATLVLACFSVVWATIFLKCWKRRQLELAYEWDTYDVEEQVESSLRPEYEQRACSTRPNPVTKEMQPYIPRHLGCVRVCLSIFVTLLMLCAIAAALVALVMGRIALYGAFKQAGSSSYVELGRWTAHGLIFVTVVVLDTIYDRVAHHLTSLECPRTASKWLSSFLWKVFIFELLNDFIPICYVAWVKGKTTKTPLDMTWYSEMCEAGECLGEVMELVAVLLLARLVIGNAMEIGIPFLKRVFARAFRFRDSSANGQERPSAIRGRPWRLDYLLGELELDGVAEEYMEMVVQFAYCTLFVPALPVAPFVCLLNNILEIRIDAINLTNAHRRPLPVRAAGIGIWYDFLNVVTKLAVFCNAGLIAFTSQTVEVLYHRRYSLPRLHFTGWANGAHSGVVGLLGQFGGKIASGAFLFMEDCKRTTKLVSVIDGSIDAEKSGDYAYVSWSRGSDTTFTDFKKDSLSVLDASAWGESSEFRSAVDELPYNVSECWYSDYRVVHHPYHVKSDWWEIMCARVITFALFIVVSFLFQWFVNFIVDDTPSHVKLKIQRRRYVVSKATEAGGAFDLWLSKAVKRESTMSHIFPHSSTNRNICRRRSVRSSISSIASTISGEQTQNGAAAVIQHWKQVAFGERRHRRVERDRSQKTLDAVDIEEEDL